MKLSLEFLDADIKEHNNKSADGLARVEAKLTPSELMSSRATLKEHMDYIAMPIKQNLSEKREYLRRNQPSVTDLVTMRNKERNFPKKNNPPPQKRKQPSAALGAPPAQKQKGNTGANDAPIQAEENNQDGLEYSTPQTERQRPQEDLTRGGGYYHYSGRRSGKPRRGRRPSRGKYNNVKTNRIFKNNGGIRAPPANRPREPTHGL